DFERRSFTTRRSSDRVTGILLGGVYALVSVGLTLIFGVLGIVNFAHGTLLTVAMYLAYVLVTSVGINVYVAAAIGVPVLFGLGRSEEHTSELQSRENL